MNKKRRKRAQVAPRESEVRFRSLFENADEIIFTCDLLGNFTSFSRAGEKLTGYSCEEALNMNFAQIVAPEFFEFANQMARTTVEEEATVYEIEIVTRSGRRVAVEISSRPLCVEDRPIGVQSVARDITERDRG